MQQACARALIAAGRYSDAYSHYQKMLAIFPGDTDALVNYGILAAKLGHPEEAIDSWQKAIDINPEDARAHLYLAGVYDQRGEVASAARHWNAFVSYETAHPGDPAVPGDQITLATIHLADDEMQLNQNSAARTQYEFAITLAQQTANPKLESLALVHLADLQEKLQDAPGAAQSFQRALALDAKGSDPESEGLDWFNYGQFLRRHTIPNDLVYACFLESEKLLASTAGPSLITVQTMKRQIETKMTQPEIAKSEKNLAGLLIQSTTLTSASF